MRCSPPNSHSTYDAMDIGSREPLVVELVVPHDAGPGTKLEYVAPDGQELRLTVPDGVPPGSIMTLTQDPQTLVWRCMAEPGDSRQDGLESPGATHQLHELNTFHDAFTAPAIEAPSPVVTRHSSQIHSGSGSSASSAARHVVPGVRTAAPAVSYATPIQPSPAVVIRQGVPSYSPPVAAVVRRSYAAPEEQARATENRPSYTPPPVPIQGRPSYTPPPGAIQGRPSYTPPAIMAASPMQMRPLSHVPPVVQSASYAPPAAIEPVAQYPSYAPPPMVVRESRPSYTPPVAMMERRPSYTPLPLSGAGVPIARLAQAGGDSHLLPSVVPAQQITRQSSYVPPPRGGAQTPSYAPPPMGGPSITTLPSQEQMPLAAMAAQLALQQQQQMQQQPMGGSAVGLQQMQPSGLQLGFPNLPFIQPQIGLPLMNMMGGQGSMTMPGGGHSMVGSFVPPPDLSAMGAMGATMNGPLPPLGHQLGHGMAGSHVMPGAHAGLHPMNQSPLAACG